MARKAKKMIVSDEIVTEALAAEAPEFVLADGTGEEGETLNGVEAAHTIELAPDEATENLSDEELLAQLAAETVSHTDVFPDPVVLPEQEEPAQVTPAIAAQAKQIEEEDSALIAKSGDNALIAARKKFLQRVAKLGEDAGAGVQSLPTLAREAVRAAADRLFGSDEAEDLYVRFQKRRHARMGKIYEKEDSIKNQVSKLRQIMLVGAAFGEEGVDMIELAYELRIAAAAQPETAKAMKPGTTYAFLVDVAREQLDDKNKGIVLDQGGIERVMFPEKKEKTLADEAKRLYEGAVKLKKGKKATGDKDAVPGVDSASLEAAIDYLQETWFELDPEARAAWQAAEQARRDKIAKEQAALAAFKSRPLHINLGR